MQSYLSTGVRGVPATASRLATTDDLFFATGEDLCFLCFETAADLCFETADDLCFATADEVADTHNTLAAARMLSATVIQELRGINDFLAADHAYLANFSRWRCHCIPPRNQLAGPVRRCDQASAKKNPA